MNPENPAAAGPALRPVEDRPLFSRCANPRCATGWMQLWRNRRKPLFESQWACSPECMSAIVRAAVRREGPAERGRAPGHCVPIGLLLVGQGHLSLDQLRRALAERAGAGAAESMRLGEWLVASGVLGETVLTSALSAQWRAPVFSVRDYQPEPVAPAMPRLLSEALGAVPLRLAGGKLLYLLFDGTIHRSLAYGLERMLGLRIVSGIAPDSEFQTARFRYAHTQGPKTTLCEASDADAWVRAVTARLERDRPANARMVRVHEYFWLRLWRQNRDGAGLPGSGDVEDMVATVGQGFAGSH